MFWRLFLPAVGLLLATIGVLGAVIAGRVEQHQLTQIEESLRTKAILVQEAVRERASNQDLLQKRLVALRQEIATRMTLLDSQSRVLADSEQEPAPMENHAGRPEVQEARASGIGTATRYSTTTGGAMMYVAIRASGDVGNVSIVRVALPLDKVQRQLAELRRIVWTTAALTALVALALTYWLARRITRPLQELTAGAERIAAGGFGHKVFPGGPDEIGTLALAFNDMSERLAEQLALLEADREQLRMILGGMVEGVVALDAEQRILFANERAAQLLDLRPGAADGHKLWEVVRRRPLQELVERALTSSKPERQEMSWNGPAARNLTVHAARLPGYPPRGAVLVLHDTTELRRLERVRQEFVANVSHELKTPLSVITACVETLLDGAVDDLEHRGPFLTRIADQAERLHALILDLISLARIESGEEVLELQPLPLGPVVAACLERHRARAEARGQTLEAVPPHDGNQAPDPTAWADEEAVGQILDNLVDNALKYTPDGGRIRVGWQARDGQVCVQVEDTGIGIPEQDLPRIFERFYRVDKARSREVGGTGLGLSIVKHLVQAMRGAVHAVSRPGKGTTFTVWLPLAPGR
jgi:two-component system phosphate regulon sensor histidine kinase PhoR